MQGPPQTPQSSTPVPLLSVCSIYSSWQRKRGKFPIHFVNCTYRRLIVSRGASWRPVSPNAFRYTGVHVCCPRGAGNCPVLGNPGSQTWPCSGDSLPNKERGSAGRVDQMDSVWRGKTWTDCQGGKRASLFHAVFK